MLRSLRIATVGLVVAALTGCSEKKGLPESASVDYFRKFSGKFVQQLGVSSQGAMDAINTQTVATMNGVFAPPSSSVVGVYLSQEGVKADVATTKSEASPRVGNIYVTGELVVEEVKVAPAQQLLSAELARLLAGLGPDQQRMKQALAQAETNKLRPEADVYEHCLAGLEEFYQAATAKKAGLEQKREHFDTYAGTFQLRFAYQKLDDQWNWVPAQWSFNGMTAEGRRMTRQFPVQVMQKALDRADVQPDELAAVEQKHATAAEDQRRLTESLTDELARDTAQVAEYKALLESIRKEEKDKIVVLATKRQYLAAALKKYTFPSGTEFQDATLALPANWNAELFPKDNQVYMAFWDPGKTDFSHAICFDDGLFHGAAAHFWPDTKRLKVLANYERGNRHGELRLGNEDGTAVFYQEYVRGRKHGVGCLFAEGSQPRVLLNCVEGKVAEAAEVANFQIQLLDGQSEAFAGVVGEVQTLEDELYEDEQGLRRDLNSWYREIVEKVRRSRASALSASSREGRLAIQAAARAAASDRHRVLLGRALQGKGMFDP